MCIRDSYEADTWAGIEGTDIVGAAHVEKALAEKIQRSNKYEQKILEAIEEGHLLLDLEGADVYKRQPGDDPLPRRGCGHITGGYGCYNIYETADGKYMSLGALEPIFWQNFCNAVGRPEWVEKQFNQSAQEGLFEELKALFQEKTQDEWVKFFVHHEACCEPVLDLDADAAHPLAREQDF